MESNYLRYYWPVIGFLVVLMALGIQTLFDRISILKKEGATRLFSFFPTLFLFFTVSQLFSSAVPGPSKEHLKYYLEKHIRWESRYYSMDMGPYLDFVEGLPHETRMFVHGTELVSSIPRKTFSSDTATIVQSGVRNYSPSDLEKLRNPTALWLQKNIFGIEGYKPRLKNPFPFNEEKAPVEGMVLEYGDVVTVFNIWSYQFLVERNRFFTADRLLYSSSDVGGVQSRFIASFRINDELLGKPEGIYREFDKKDISGNVSGNVIWYQVKLAGQKVIVPSLGDVVIENQNFLQGEVSIPEGSKNLKIVANLKYLGTPDPSVGLSILYKDGGQKLIKKTTPAVFSGSSMAAYLVLDKIPEHARTIMILVSPAIDKKVGIQSFNVFYEKFGNGL